MIQIPVHGELFRIVRRRCCTGCSNKYSVCIAATSGGKQNDLPRSKLLTLLLMSDDLYLLLGRQMGVKGILSAALLHRVTQWCCYQLYTISARAFTRNYCTSCCARDPTTFMRCFIIVSPTANYDETYRQRRLEFIRQITSSAFLWCLRFDVRVCVAPFFFSVAKEENAKQIFSRIDVLCFCCAVCFSRAHIFYWWSCQTQHLRSAYHSPQFWAACISCRLCYWICFSALQQIFRRIYIEKRTSLTPIVRLPAVVNVAANYFWYRCMHCLRDYGQHCLHISMAILHTSQHKVYPIRYEWGRVALLAVISFVLTVLFILLQCTLRLKIIFIDLFSVVAFVFKFFRTEEIEKWNKYFIANKFLTSQSMLYINRKKLVLCCSHYGVGAYGAMKMGIRNSRKNRKLTW